MWVWDWGWAWGMCRNQAQAAPGDEGWCLGLSPAVQVRGAPRHQRPERHLLACAGAGHAVVHALRLQHALVRGLHSERFRCLWRSGTGHLVGLSHAVRGGCPVEGVCGGPPPGQD